MNLGTIWAEVRVKTDKFIADVNAIKVQTAATEKSLNTITKKMNTTAASIGKAGTAFLIAGAAITGAVGLMVKAAADGEVAETRLATALKAAKQYSDENQKSLIALSEKMADVSGISHDAIQQMLGFGLQLGFATKQVEQLTPKILDWAAATGTDLETGMKMARAAMEGNTGALSRYGIYIDKAKDGTVKFDDILNAFAGYAGSAEAKGKTLSGQIAILKEHFDRLMETLGEKLIPVVKDLIAKYLVPLIDRIKAIPPETLENIVKFTALVGVILLVSGTVLNLVKLLMNLGSAIITVVSKVVWGAQAIMAALGPVGWVLLAITAAVALFVVAWKKDWGHIREHTEHFIEFFKGVGKTIGEHLSKLAPFFTGLRDTIKGAFEKGTSAVQSFLSSIGNMIKSLREKSPIIDGIFSTWEKGIDAIKSAAIKFKDKIIEVFSTAIDKVKAFYNEMVNKGKDANDSVIKAARVANETEITNKGKVYAAIRVLAKENANAEARLAQQTVAAEIAFKQKSVKINEQLTSEQINDELTKLEAARKQKERQAWLDAAKEKLLAAETEDDKAAITKEIQSQLDAWQYEDTVDSYKKRQTIIDQATQDAIDAAQKVADEEKRLSDLIDQYMVEGAAEADRIDQERADKRQAVENTLADYLYDIHERERDAAIKILNQEATKAEDIIQKEIDARIKQYNTDVDLIYKERDVRLGALSKQITDLEAQHEKEARANTMADLRVQLAAAATAEERARIQKEINAQVNEWAYQDKLDKLRKEQEDTRTAAEEDAKLLEKAYADKALLTEKEMARLDIIDKDWRDKKSKSTLEDELKTTQNLYKDKIDAKNAYYDDLELSRNLDAEADKLLAEKTMTEILAMLGATKAQWATLGSEIGDTFWGNIEDAIKAMQAFLDIVGGIHPPGVGGHYAFAEGGAVYGPTLALLGENATPSNPEIIIPPGKGFGQMAVTYNIYGASDMAALRRELSLHDKELLNMMRGGRW